MDLIVREFIRASVDGEIKNWRLKLVGAGAKLAELEGIVAEHNADELVVITPPVPREVVFELMQEADALYLSLQKSFVFEHTIPSKVFDYLAMSRPILSAIGGEGREIIESTGANLCVEPGDAAGLQVALETLSCEIETLQSKAIANRKLVLERFTREKAVEQLLVALNRVTN